MMQMEGCEGDDGRCGLVSFPTRSMVEADEGEKGKRASHHRDLSDGGSS
jgi:hypothetical protein